MTTTWPYNVEGFRRIAQRRLPKPLFEFVDGGAGDEATLRANRLAFERYSFVPRILVDVSQRDLSTVVAGVKLRLPVVFAPTGVVGLVHPDGELAAAEVAARQGLLDIVSGNATYTLEEVASAAGPGQWLDIFPWKDRSVRNDIIDRAQAAGYSGLCLTVDTTLSSNRERDWANGWTSPPKLSRNAYQYAKRPAWVLRTLHTRRGQLRNFDATLPTLWSFIGKTSASAASTMGGNDQTMTWADLELIRDRWSGPLAVKGAFSVADAKRLSAIGVNALLVGNHGGRQLDGLQSSLDMLTDLVDSVGDDIDLVLDGGIRRGTDVVKALCLGAKACTLGRAAVYALAAGGTAGVTALVGVVEREIDVAMGLVGATSIEELDRSFLRYRHREW